MTMQGIILYGPPASGKDTVTAELRKLDSGYVLYRRLKAGPGRRTGYRMTTESEIDALRAAGEVIWENRRYGSTYVVDRPALIRQLAESVPVVHLGQEHAVPLITAATPTVRWLVVSLWCPRDDAERRIQARGTGDFQARLAAWDETKPLARADLVIDTASVSASGAAAEIHRAMTGTTGDHGLCTTLA
jgi:guanylate kinase